MPRVADPDERRASIAEALVRVAVREGLAAVTMRAVAAEAGVSLRLVQYYFETKAGMMVGALEHLERLSHARWEQRIASLPQPVPARALIEAFLAEALPDDRESRAFHLMFSSYAVLSMHDATLAAQPFVAGPQRLEKRLTTALAAARDDGSLPESRDPRGEAARLLALANGLGTGVLVGQRTVREARKVAAAHVADLFGSA